jgi:hypothetical protein
VRVINGSRCNINDKDELELPYEVGDIVETDYSNTMRGGRYKVISKVWEGRRLPGGSPFSMLPLSGWRVKVEALPGSAAADLTFGGWCASWFFPVKNIVLAGGAPAKKAKVINDYPGVCPKCKGPAYIGFNVTVDCKRKCS